MCNTWCEGISRFLFSLMISHNILELSEKPEAGTLALILFESKFLNTVT